MTIGFYMHKEHFRKTNQSFKIKIKINLIILKLIFYSTYPLVVSQVHQKDD